MVDSLLGNKNGRQGRQSGIEAGRRGRAGARLVRTVVLGSILVAAAVYWLAKSYGVDMAELYGYLRASVAFVILFAGAGLLAALGLYLLRRLRRR